ncbi:MAG: hypothetical protein RSF40_01455 [Oscillospiraceae bacterium]
MVAVNKIRIGQIYTVGAKTKSLVKQYSNIEIGNKVEILSHPHYCLITVRDLKTGVEFDVDNKCLGVLVCEVHEA